MSDILTAFGFLLGATLVAWPAYEWHRRRAPWRWLFVALVVGVAIGTAAALV